MPRHCDFLKDAVICHSGPRRLQCRWCKNPHTKLCDYPVGRTTCNAPMCDEHANHVEGKNIDYCPIHVGKPGTIKSLL